MFSQLRGYIFTIFTSRFRGIFGSRTSLLGSFPHAAMSPNLEYAVVLVKMAAFCGVSSLSALVRPAHLFAGVFSGPLYHVTELGVCRRTTTLPNLRG